MKYITGNFALNLNCPSLGTPGDWHQSALNWQNIHTENSEKSVFGDYGITPSQPIPENPDNTLPIANHIRACLDLIAAGRFSSTQGMKDNFIDNDKYTKEIFEKIFLLKFQSNWNEISEFMKKEYKLQWIKFLKGDE